MTYTYNHLYQDQLYPSLLNSLSRVDSLQMFCIELSQLERFFFTQIINVYQVSQEQRPSTILSITLREALLRLEIRCLKITLGISSVGYIIFPKWERIFYVECYTSLSPTALHPFNNRISVFSLKRKLKLIECYRQ